MTGRSWIKFFPPKWNDAKSWAGCTESPCAVCSPQSCRVAYLYVAVDAAGLVKIGQTVDPSQRLKTYRKDGKPSVRFVLLREADCAFMVKKTEAQAQSKLPDGNRVQGDWYDVDAELAIAAVQSVLGRAA